MNIMQFFRILWARRAIIITAVAACLTAAILVIKIVPPRYEASSRLMLDIVRPDPVTGEIMSSQFARAYVKTQVELIQDYRVAGKVVDSFGWTGSPELAAAYRAAGASVDFRRWLAQRVIDRTDAGLIEGSNILEIRYTGDNPQTSARIADAIRQAYSDQTRAFKQQTAARNAAWFNRQTEQLRTRLLAAEQRKAAFERENNIVLNDDASDAESQRLSSIASAGAAAPMMTATPAMPVATSPSQLQLTQLDAAIATASQTLGPNHPELQNMQRQREVLAAAASREMAAARSAGGGAVMSGPSIGAQFSAQQSRVLAQRGLVAEARQLLVDVTVLREQLARTAARASDLDQESQSTETGLTFLGSAVAPQSPSFPKIPLLVFGALGLGLGLGIMVALLAELLNRRVRGVEDLGLPGVPVLGVMAPPLQRQRRSLLSYLPRRLQPGGAAT